LLLIIFYHYAAQPDARRQDRQSAAAAAQFCAAAAAGVIDLTIDFDGTLLWNKSPVDRKTLQGYIESEAQKQPQPEVHITVDKFAKYEIVAQTLADLQHRGLKEDRLRPTTISSNDGTLK